MAVVHCISARGNVGVAGPNCRACTTSDIHACAALLRDPNRLITFWGSGRPPATLFSTSYGSCVGMALNDVHGGGISVLTHCWGAGNVAEAVEDARTILAEYWDDEPGRATEATVFGGSDPKDDSRERIEAIAQALAASGCPAVAKPNAGATEATLHCGQVGGLILTTAGRPRRGSARS